VILERVRLIDGELTIESNPGRGARLEIRVPKHRDAEYDNKRSQTIRIVIADDHPIFRDGLRRLLEAEPGLKVIGEASDGNDAVKLARQLKPDVMLLDLAMPRQPGLEALLQDPLAMRILDGSVLPGDLVRVDIDPNRTPCDSSGWKKKQRLLPQPGRGGRTAGSANEIQPQALKIDCVGRAAG